MKKLTILIALFMLLTLLSACKKESPSPSPSPSALPSALPSPSARPSPSPTPSASPAPTALVNPLTGLPMDEDKLNNRPYAFMLNNLKKALPMSGVSKADVIYEALAEGGITRLLGVYQDISALGDIGTIRSTRTYYLELALGHDALLVHSGASYIAYGEISSWKMDTLDYGRNSKLNTAFWRNSARVKKVGSEHSVYTNGEKLLGAMENLDVRKGHGEGYDLGWQFADDGKPAGGKSADKVTASFQSGKNTVFTYDAETKLYAVEEYGAAFMDEAQDRQIAVTNVLVLHTDIAPIPKDSAGRITTRLTGEGVGEFACGGAYAPIRWSKKWRDDPFVFTFENASPLVFGRGQTYICIVPTDRKTEIS